VTFQQRPSTYRIERAPTGRARCRACKRCIAKGQPRVAITAFVRPGRSAKLLRCAECLDARFGAAVRAVYGEAARVPADEDVDAAEAARVRARLEGAR
jgi:flavoprotein